jgi:phospholipase A-2-activating protein
VNFRERSNGNGGLANLDPFTGSSSYSSGGKQDFMVKKHIPTTTFMSFDTCDASKVLVKLKEFNNLLSENVSKVSETELEKVVALISSQDSPNDSSVESLKKMITYWPNEKLFPILDVIRMAVRSAEFCSKFSSMELVEFIKEKIPTNAANQLMSIRAICNMMKHETGREVVKYVSNDIIPLLTKIRQGTATLQNAIATFYLNQSINNPSEELCRILCIEIVQFLEWTNDPESTYRAYLAIGNLVAFNSSVALSMVKTANVLIDGLNRNRSSPHANLAEISSELSDKLAI